MYEMCSGSNIFLVMAASFDVVPCDIRGNGGTNVFHYCLDPVASYPISHCTEGEDTILCLFEKSDE